VVRRSGPGAAAIRIGGSYGIPGVDFSGSTTGLSADGRTLVLAELPGSGVTRTTRLVVLDTPRLTVRARLALPGFSTVDAISPNGRWLYLIQYSGSNAASYAVRAYDLRTRHMIAAPVVDPRDRGEAMTGIPMTRVTSADGRWAYTLYSRPSGAPFIHALDTTHRRAVCIDLPSLSNLDFGMTHLTLGSGGAALYIDTPETTPTVIDTRTFAVRTAPQPAPPAERPVATRPALHPGRNGRTGTPWNAIALAIVVAAGLAAALSRRARRTRGSGGVRVPGAVALTDDEGHLVYRIEADSARETAADQRMPAP
jgi:hypothetical protein